MYHAFELGFCGYAGSGKTTLISRLTKSFSSRYRVGYMKANAHGFTMDREGKDTCELSRSGAGRVAICSEDKWATLSATPMALNEKRLQFSDCEMVFLEGAKNSKIGKIVVLDQEMSILEVVRNGEISNVVAFVGSREKDMDLEKPYFHRDDVDSIQLFVEQYFQSFLAQTPLYGLVLSGGHSKRMGRDKALLDYHGHTQTEYYFKMVSKFCEKTFVSSRKNQWEDGKFDHLPQIYDKMENLGPMGGILSAMMEEPKVAWLVVACDLPFLKEDTLNHLIRHRFPFRLATAFDSAHGGLPEPLCAIYEPRSRSRLFEFLGMGYQCPRKVLINSLIGQLELPVQNALDNANDEEEFKRMRKSLKEVQFNG